MNKQCLCAVFVSCIVVFAVLFVGLLFGHGTGQAFTPYFLEHKLRIGMTTHEVSYALGIPESSLRDGVENLGDGRFAAYISRPGLGMWLAPQHETRLEFDGGGKLVTGYANIVQPFSEDLLALEFGKTQPNDQANPRRNRP